jgi:hypothetical protein
VGVTSGVAVAVKVTVGVLVLVSVGVGVVVACGVAVNVTGNVGVTVGVSVIAAIADSSGAKGVAERVAGIVSCPVVVRAGVRALVDVNALVLMRAALASTGVATCSQSTAPVS